VTNNAALLRNRTTAVSFDDLIRILERLR
jgi:hypothetical protein